MTNTLDFGNWVLVIIWLLELGIGYLENPKSARHSLAVSPHPFLTHGEGRRGRTC